MKNPVVVNDLPPKSKSKKVAQVKITSKEQAIEDIIRRRAENVGKRENNESLPAGSPMYFYCLHCAGLSDILPETYINKPNRICKECKPLVEAGYL